MSEHNLLLTPNKKTQLQDSLLSVIANPVKEASLSIPDQWLWSIVKANQEQALGLELIRILLTTRPDPSLLIGLLIRQRNQARKIIETKQAEVDLLQWLTQQLKTQNNSLDLAACILIFQYLISSYVIDNQVVELLTRISVTHPQTCWNPDSDLTLESGATGWMLMCLKAQKKSIFRERIDIGVSDINLHLNRYIDYLHNHQIPIDGALFTESIFPTSVCDTRWKIAENQSWRQGDLGHLLLLYEASCQLGNPNLAAWADRLGGYLSFLRQSGRLRQTDIGLMTGTAGLSLMYRRLHILTNQPNYLSEGLFWLDETLGLLQQPTLPIDDSLRTGRLGVVFMLKHWLGHNTGLDLLQL